MKPRPPLLSLTVLILALAACSSQPAARADPPSPALAASTLAVTSDPADGSTVSGPVNLLVLNFSAPVALSEVTVEGPDGLMPMMLSSAGAQTRFEIPLPGLTGGRYTARWKALHDGAPSAGSLTFTVR